jgi:hypothetical protein
MYSIKLWLSACLLAACSIVPASAQQVPASINSNAVVPPVSRFSGVLTDGHGKAQSGVVGVTFALYKDSEGGAPLWVETQNLHPDQLGHYTVTLGSTTTQGLPSELFASGEARWLGVQPQGQAEKARVLLMSVPYALKAMDAETLGGKPASAFLQASAGQNAPGAAITGSGQANHMTRWLSASKLGSSDIVETNGNVGIGTTAPASKLDVNGTTDVRSTLTLFPNGNSPALAVSGSAFSIASTGLLTFASGQTFSGVPSLSSANTFTAAQTITTTGNAALSLTNGNTNNGDTIAILNNSFNGLHTEGGTYGVFANNAVIGVYGQTKTGVSGVYGDNQADANYSSGVYGKADGKTKFDLGVFGYSASNDGYGIYGLSQQVGGLGTFDPAGVWGDSNAGNGVMGTSKQQEGIVGITNDSINQFNPAGYFNNSNTNPFDLVLETFGENVGGSCVIDNSGDLSCTGSKSAVVPVDQNSRMVALYAIESPKNWFEDFGSGQLSNGSTTIRLERVFSQTVDLDVNYHVYLTPNGDCKGLYITRKTPTSFEVHELGRGTSNVGFDYRIVAERKGYENVRLADRTMQFKNASMKAKGLLKGPALPMQPPTLPAQKGVPAQSSSHVVKH